jgi:hypothetical protein
MVKDKGVNPDAMNTQSDALFSTKNPSRKCIANSSMFTLELI